VRPPLLRRRELRKASMLSVDLHSLYLYWDVLRLPTPQKAEKQGCGEVLFKLVYSSQVEGRGWGIWTVSCLCWYPPPCPGTSSLGSSTRGHPCSATSPILSSPGSCTVYELPPHRGARGGLSAPCPFLLSPPAHHKAAPAACE